jgi:hypothetical protein
MSETAEFEDVVCTGESTDAICCRVGERKLWIPKSQVHDDSEVYDVCEGREGKLVITQWFAEKTGLV